MWEYSDEFRVLSWGDQSGIEFKIKSSITKGFAMDFYMLEAAMKVWRYFDSRHLARIFNGGGGGGDFQSDF